jgi:hypothetical protein
MSGLSKGSKGVGRVFAGTKFIAEVQYDFGWYRHYDEDGIPEPPSPNLDVTDPPRIQGERLTLHMNDGCKLDFSVSAQGYCTVEREPYL